MTPLDGQSVFELLRGDKALFHRPFEVRLRGRARDKLKEAPQLVKNLSSGHDLQILQITFNFAHLFVLNTQCLNPISLLHFLSDPISICDRVPSEVLNNV